MQGISERFAAARVAVVGDLMLDVYIEGEVHRVSPEAPVPVVRLTSERVVPGGAANVAANIASLGGTVTLVGVAGRDSAFAQLSEELQRVGRVDLSTTVFDDSRGTTTKTRLLGHRQQIARIDRETLRPIAPEIETQLIERACTAIDGCDIVILSDYGKGVLTDLVLQRTLAYAQAVGKRVLVDPKRRDLSAYRGASIITPNRAELALATGRPCETDEEAEEAARLAHEICGADVLLTRSEKGMSYFARSGDSLHFATIAREVFDVSGAGDTVVAVLGAALAAGFPLVEAMKASNHAAGLVVAKVGTATVSCEELVMALHGGAQALDVEDGRLVTLDELMRIRAFWRANGLTVGIANGCFDLIHPGHVSLIRQAAAASDRLVMALNTDASVRRLKGPTRPVQTETARAEVMGALKGVAAVVLFDEDTPYDLIKALQPDVLVKGADYTEELVVGADIVRARGGTVLLAVLTPGQSTTRLISQQPATVATHGDKSS
ncbi:D-beta-D-heptose 7-phosphate kinase/D-beta-D-heptose 1-phosphate adenosyltransferase [Inquilinus ginsengisoli]|uniref:D-glycero-beta-D-manno-heptose-7-phosphate kinase n=1 Tax=Inquilinus ginsengisoli TaxID=363840 RepID=UPI003D1A98EE